MALNLLRYPVAPLFVPGNRPERFEKAATSGADAIIIDLEDAVAPEQKALAREAVRNNSVQGLPVIVRINAADTPWFSDDLAMLATVKPAAIMVPKAAGAALIAHVAQQTGIAAVIPLVESVAGLAGLEAMLRSPGVFCAAFGALDLALDLGCRPDWQPLLMARSELVLRSRLCGIAAPIDGVTPALDNADEVRADAQRARDFGFRGKLAIHPNQIAPIRQGFGPSKAERAWAEAVLARGQSGDGAAEAGGAMIDKPVLERARRIMEQAP